MNGATNTATLMLVLGLSACNGSFVKETEYKIYYSEITSSYCQGLDVENIPSQLFGEGTVFEVKKSSRKEVVMVFPNEQLGTVTCEMNNADGSLYSNSYFACGIPIQHKESGEGTHTVQIDIKGENYTSKQDTEESTGAGISMVAKLSIACDDCGVNTPWALCTYTPEEEDTASYSQDQYGLGFDVEARETD